MPRGDHAFREVTGRNPCPVCNGTGWCRVDAAGCVALCRRVPDGGRGRLDRGGVAYFVHHLRPGPLRVGDARPVDRMVGSPALTPVEVRGDVYAATLRALTLDATHRGNLRDRGLPDAEIGRRGYASLPPPGPPWRREVLARELANRYTPEVLAGVPGFVRRESRGGRGYLTLAGSPGLLVPVRDLDGRTVALKVRRDAPGDGPRYLTVSSVRDGGPGPGAPVHVPTPLEDGRDPDRVRLTEGELKADVATVLDPDRILTVSAPGVAAWRAALPVLAALRPRTVRLAFDRDAWTNPHVARALRDAAAGIEAAGFNLEIETW